jgi:hypothetical protein
MAYYEACLTTISMNEPFSIVPPPEQVQQWSDIKPMEDAVVQNWVKIATQAAQWGADQELDACCEWLQWWDDLTAACQLRATRRPKPPSLKEQALASLAELESPDRCDEPGYESICNTIRLALEALDA